MGSEGRRGAPHLHRDWLRPVALGTRVIVGGSVRIVSELAGGVNGMGKELRTKNLWNNARVVNDVVSRMKQFKEDFEKRGYQG
ncbi:hypothetical protein KP509_17G025300 [Ceratopteris richardii]|uniref:Small ribosomal subunit protein uS5 C-terminal domain-containing protein n=1 Tax=Ceratopteris richardii TaxID=49495 RepID=A0A8T2SUV4_CERRI|nr:hypothetical protein KP509_17G025300 [Ceratopteris richardii]